MYPEHAEILEVKELARVTPVERVAVVVRQPHKALSHPRLGPLGFNSPNIAQRHVLHVESTRLRAQFFVGFFIFFITLESRAE